MIKTLLFSTFFISTSFIATASTSHEASIKRPTYICQRAETPPKIDGNLYDDVWQKAVYSAPFVDIEGSKIRVPNQQTRFKMLWDDTYLYVAAKISEKHIWATLRERDSIIYQDPDFEVFIDPDCDGKNYIELEINALNTIWDLFLSGPYSDPNQVVLHDWDIKNIKTAVEVDGTLNNPTDEDYSWTVEIAIPWESITGHANLPRRGDPPTAGTKMRMNFSKVGWKTDIDLSSKHGYKKQVGENGKPLPETNDVWAATGKVNIHMPECWGDVYFSKNVAGTWESNFGEKNTGAPKIYLWVHGGEQNVTDEAWAKRLNDYKAGGVDIIVADGNVAQVTKIAKLAKEAGLKTIAWVWTMNQCGDKEIFKPKNKNWFSVSRTGKSCYEESDRPYVGYYAFLCPNNPDALEHLKGIIEKYAAIPHLEAIQLDYIRMVDVILPRGLWEKYGLVQDHEMPEFDFCYCNLCIKKFKTEYGRSVDLKNAEDDIQWRKFRLDSIAKVANELAKKSRELRLPCGAAVFPTPEIASTLVRQDWSLFNIDFAFPMDYNSFYNEPSSWIAEKTKEAVGQIKSAFPIAPGIHLPDIPAESLPALLDEILKNGGNGVALFSNEAFTPAHAKAIREWKNRLEASREHSAK